jgi:hypothetical protein
VTGRAPTHCRGRPCIPSPRRCKRSMCSRRGQGHPGLARRSVLKSQREDLTGAADNGVLACQRSLPDGRQADFDRAVLECWRGCASCWPAGRRHCSGSEVARSRRLCVPVSLTSARAAGPRRGHHGVEEAEPAVRLADVAPCTRSHSAVLRLRGLQGPAPSARLLPPAPVWLLLRGPQLPGQSGCRPARTGHAPPPTSRPGAWPSRARRVYGEK